MKKSILLLSFLFLLFYLPNKAHSEEPNQFITIVNPVRISLYNPNPAKSLASQYQIILKNNLPATWLVTFDVLKRGDMVTILGNMDRKQEIGLLLEVTPELAKAAGVSYHETGSWHHATSVFLSGYTQEERKLLIDTVFEKFKERFGYYPTSVGSWWTDSFSLSYMKEKYGITANLGLADQFSTDGYQVWGSFWSTPFYPSKYHAGIPASDPSVKLDLITIQWAPRDPFNGYYSSLYSTQDYHTIGLKFDYFQKLIDLYAKKHKNEFGQITVGLEADLSPQVYSGEFLKQMSYVAYLAQSGEFQVANIRDFSDWYRKTFPALSPSYLIEADDLLGKAVKTFWYQSPKYRIGLFQTVKDGKVKTKIVDLRTYHKDLQEPYYQSPNREFELSIYIPSIFDEVNNKEDVWDLSFGPIVSFEGSTREFKIDFGDGKSLILRPNEILIEFGELALPEVLKKHPALEGEKTRNLIKITPKDKWIAPQEGIILKGLTSEATHFLKQKRVWGGLAGLSLVIVTFVLLILQFLPWLKLVAVALVAVPLVGAGFWFQKNTTPYLVNQGELDALFRLSVLAGGKVLVFDNECLQCSYHTKYKPAAFANKKEYVQKFGRHPIVYNAQVFGAKTQDEARKEFAKLNVKYIYLVKFEDYIEKVPFSPGDLGIEKIYDNANAELWRIKE